MASWKDKLYAATGMTPPPVKDGSSNACVKCGHLFLPKTGQPEDQKWCPGCVAEIRGMRKTKDEVQAMDKRNKEKVRKQLLAVNQERT